MGYSEFGEVNSAACHEWEGGIMGGAKRTGLFVAYLLVIGTAAAQPGAGDSNPSGSAHEVGAAKLIVEDLKEAQGYFEEYFGMTEVQHYDTERFEESIMAFDEGARLALFAPKIEGPLKKSQYPVVLIYTPEFDALAKRIEEGGQPIRHLPSSASGRFRIAIAQDPSGNSVEILARDGQPMAVGGSKLIVNDRKEAEEFYIRTLGLTPGNRYTTEAYDEVIMGFGAGPFLALFEPKAEAALKKSIFPVVAIYTTEFDAVLERIDEAGLGYRMVPTSTPDRRIIVAQDPAGNAIEIISR